MGKGDYIINEYEAKAAVYDKMMSKIADRDFEEYSAIAADVLNIIFDIARKE